MWTFLHKNGYMMKQLMLCVAMIGWGTLSLGQTLIQGKVLDNKDKPVPLANVYLEGILDGSTTNEKGVFSFTTEAESQAVLVVSRMGYEAVRKVIDLQNQPVSLVLRIQKANLNVAPVVITAGAFEASDEKKGTVLKPLDIVTNAGAAGDLYGAIQTLPGVSPTANETGIFVRGGGAYEIKTIIDGTIVPRPFFTDVPNIPSRGRFDPFLFKGTLFSTGGYSAEYGQALSSVLLLNTQDMPDRSNMSLSLNLVGIGASMTKLWNQKTAFMASINGSYLDPYFALINNNRNWIKAPRGYDVTLGARHKTRSGMFKTYFQHQQGNLLLELDNLDELSQPHRFENQNANTFWTSSYKGILGDAWSVFAALAVSRDVDEDQFDQYSIDEHQDWIQSRLTLGRDVGSKLYVKFGGEFHYRQDDLTKGFNGGSFDVSLPGTYTAFYAESDIKLTQNVAIRLGGRGEYAGVLGQWNAAPRTSLAFKTGKSSQVSLAYGHFYQTPEPTFLWDNAVLDYEKSAHWLINYQWFTEAYTLRIEAYQKDYTQLVKFDEVYAYDNAGGGYARGIDFFWRDKATVPNLDYWITYSYVDTERDFRDFPEPATPSFVSPHTFNVIGNYQIGGGSTRLGLSYTYASGRTFTNPNKEGFLNDTTIPFHNLNLNTSHLTHFLGNFTVLYASLRNPFGFEQVFGYTYSADGSLRRAINPTSRRAFFIGMFMSFSP